MIGIPVPFVVAALAVALALAVSVRRDLTVAGKRFLVAVSAVIATEALLVGLRFGFGVLFFIPIQRVLPLWVGPLAYLGFLALGLTAASLNRTLWPHLGVAVTLSLLFSVVPTLRPLLDFAIAGSYGAYTVMLVLLWMGGSDRLSLVPLSAAAALHRWTLLAAGLLVVNLALDTAIAWDFARQAGANAPTIISYGGLGILVIAAGTIVVHWGLKSASKPSADDANQALANRAADLLLSTHLYRDPSLTLTRLARRLGVPDRALSEAINTCNGVNVSQFINRFRVDDAAKRLRETDHTVSEILDAVGFLTRSNFYREFRNIYAMSPGEFRESDSGNSSDRVQGSDRRLP